VENLIGKENVGFRYVMDNFNHERWGIVVQATRFARVCLEEAIKYAHKRKTFGQRLIDHPVIRNKIAHMARNVEVSIHIYILNSLLSYSYCYSLFFSFSHSVSFFSRSFLPEMISGSN
jgi:hypothetical protein